MTKTYICDNSHVERFSLFSVNESHANKASTIAWDVSSCFQSIPFTITKCSKYLENSKIRITHTHTHTHTHILSRVKL